LLLFVFPSVSTFGEAKGSANRGEAKGTIKRTKKQQIFLFFHPKELSLQSNNTFITMMPTQKKSISQYVKTADFFGGFNFLITLSLSLSLS